MINLTKNCVNIFPCVETSYDESENQTECLKVNNDPAFPSLEPKYQTCLSQSAANYDESGTVPAKDNIITIKSDNKSQSQVNHGIVKEDLMTGTKKMKECIMVVIVVALLQIKKATIFPIETEKNKKEKDRQKE